MLAVLDPLGAEQGVDAGSGIRLGINQGLIHVKNEGLNPADLARIGSQGTGNIGL
jgi:hypothetical protein